MNQLFATHIKPLLDKHQPYELLEIGVLYGANTFSILQWCPEQNAHLVSIEPTPWDGNIPDLLKSGALNYCYNRTRSSEALTITPTFIEKVCQSHLFKHWKCYKQLSLDFLSSSTFHGADFCFLDGDHNYYTIFNELRLIHTQARSGMIILVHDIANPKCARVDYYYDENTIPPEYRHGPRQGILTAIEHFLSIYPEYVFNVLTEDARGLAMLHYLG